MVLVDFKSSRGGGGVGGQLSVSVSIVIVIGSSSSSQSSQPFLVLTFSGLTTTGYPFQMKC